ncbi:NAD-dependent epimerase/dehydratase family protein [Georgenia wangjunii]|uniref:NAD-dependent epimerase/dehydratase family protein n=1 Tax=Georgenia wangjunii TaxID=3117730 RepID=UPI002F261224
MRVVVVGASGNVGTAVLRALHRRPEVTSVVGVARRFPDRSSAPYDGAEWVRADIGEPVRGSAEEMELLAHLEGTFAGADAVVHLAWLLQPNHEREVLRRTNVEGTRRVALAAAGAGVRHLVVGSSVGAYGGVDDDLPRDETWPTLGVPTSEYSVDKAAQERVVDEVHRDNPAMVVARVRPGLIFQEAAGAEIARYFLGRFVPVRPLRRHRLPFAPLPAGVRAQALHADDVADAYARIVVQRAGGPFNLAADDLLTADALARVLDHGRLVELPPRLVRAVVAGTWHAHLQPTSPGWVDLAMSVPVMDTTRARVVLGWRPRRTAASALRELMRGIAHGEGGASVPMRPR